MNNGYAWYNICITWLLDIRIWGTGSGADVTIAKWLRLQLETRIINVLR